MAIETHSRTAEGTYKTKLKQELIAQLSEVSISESEAKGQIEAHVYKTARAYGLSIDACILLSEEIFNAMFRLDILQTYIDDPDVNEIMVNGCKPIIIEKSGQIIFTDNAFESKEALLHIIHKIVSKINRKANQSQPIVDARLDDGSRVHIVLEPIALNGPILTIRKFNDHRYTLSSILSEEAHSEVILTFLKQMILCKYNIFISGGTSSGKTTFLNALSEYIPNSERIITIEDSAEINLKNIVNLVSLETKNAEQKGGITMDALIRASLRMRPDRIIVGEIRGAEALEMINAMNTGHEGSMSTGHSNSAVDMLKRLELMLLKALDIPSRVLTRLISSSIEILIHLERSVDGTRRIREIVELMPSDDCYKTHILFERVSGQLTQKDNLLQKRKLDAYKKHIEENRL